MLLSLSSQNHFSFSRSSQSYSPFLYRLNLFTPLLILVHLLLTVGLWEGVVFGGVGLFPGLCGFGQAEPMQQHTRRHGGLSDPQSTSWREGLTKERPNNNQTPITSREPA